MGAQEMWAPSAVCFLLISAGSLAADHKCTTYGACDSWSPPSVFIPGGGNHLDIMRWGGPGYLNDTVGANSLVSVSTYDLAGPTTTPEGHSIPHNVQNRMQVRSIPFGTFLEHLATEEHQSTSRWYIEDTYIVDFMHKPSASKGLRRLVRDLPPTKPTTIPHFPGYEHVTGTPA